MKNNLLNIYCAKLSQSGDKINLTLVRGEEDKREFFTAVVKIDGKGKINAKVVDDVLSNTKQVYITLPLSVAKK